jgi:hypothetical protein
MEETMACLMLMAHQMAQPMEEVGDKNRTINKKKSTPMIVALTSMAQQMAMLKTHLTLMAQRMASTMAHLTRWA